jgi:hypothetical protein
MNWTASIIGQRDAKARRSHRAAQSLAPPATADTLRNRVTQEYRCGPTGVGVKLPGVWLSWHRPLSRSEALPNLLSGLVSVVMSDRSFTDLVDAALKMLRDAGDNGSATAPGCRRRAGMTPPAARQVLATSHRDDSSTDNCSRDACLWMTRNEHRLT